MPRKLTLKAAIAALILLCPLTVGASAMAEKERSIAAIQFKKLAEMTGGEWKTQDSPSLRIKFERAVRGSVIVELWMFEGQLQPHSMTVYHLDGEALMATHYCPQGNQPRLKMESGSTENHISFDFYDATNLKSFDQSHQHRLSFDFSKTDQVTRGEAYRKGVLSNPTEMVLVRVP
jgi:hypothetical protein